MNTGKTHRSNGPVKRAHWHSARTERRGRFARGWFWAEDEDLAFRRRESPRAWGRAAFATPSGTQWVTADKSRVRWLIQHGRMPAARAAWLAQKLHLRI